jgi:hypothetical protein
VKIQELGEVLKQASLTMSAGTIEQENRSVHEILGKAINEVWLKHKVFVLSVEVDWSDCDCYLPGVQIYPKSISGTLRKPR